MANGLGALLLELFIQTGTSVAEVTVEALRHHGTHKGLSGSGSAAAPTPTHRPNPAAPIAYFGPYGVPTYAPGSHSRYHDDNGPLVITEGPVKEEQFEVIQGHFDAPKEKKQPLHVHSLPRQGGHDSLDAFLHGQPTLRHTQSDSRIRSTPTLPHTQSAPTILSQPKSDSRPALAAAGQRSLFSIPESRAPKRVLSNGTEVKPSSTPFKTHGALSHLINTDASANFR
jgi:hypothetical protein